MLARIQFVLMVAHDIVWQPAISRVPTNLDSITSAHALQPITLHLICVLGLLAPSTAVASCSLL